MERNEIKPMTEEEIKSITENTISALRDAVDKNNPSVFQKQYKAFLKRFPYFRKHVANGKPPTCNPIFGFTTFNYKKISDKEARKMLERGRKASKIFAKYDLTTRLAFMEILNSKVAKYQSAIALTITADTGKPTKLAYDEITKAGAWFKYAKEKAKEQLEPQRTSLQTIYQPKGIVFAIGAFNYPYALTIPAIIGGLVPGNGIIIRAPQKAPNWVFPFMDATHEAIEEFSTTLALSEEQKKVLLKGLFQICCNRNNVLTEESDVVHFVGSSYVGREIAITRKNLLTIAEMGGNSVITVMESAIAGQQAEEKAEAIAKSIYNGFGPNTGQRCTAPRILCTQNNARTAAEKLATICHAGNAILGNPFNPDVSMGPLMDKHAYEKMKKAIALAKKIGAAVYGTLEAKYNNNALSVYKNKNTFWINPVAIDWGTAQNNNLRKIYQLIQHEIFAPLLHIVKSVKSLDEAIAIANTLDHDRLAGAIFTTSETDVETYTRRTYLTSLMVNGAPKDQSPYGIHGNYAHQIIGGDNHFHLYSNQRVINRGN